MAAILRTGFVFTDNKLLNIHKNLLISYLEHRTAAIYHACDTVVAPVDCFQCEWLYELGTSVEDALCHLNLARLRCKMRHHHA